MHGKENENEEDFGIRVGKRNEGIKTREDDKDKSNSDRDSKER